MNSGARMWRVAYVLAAAGVLAAIGRYYHPGLGLTALIEFPGAGHDRELAAVHDAPHYDHPDSPGYDGQFYATIAVAPSLRDAAIDAAVDTPAYRARRILLPWIAYAIGLGRPAAILQIFALENVAAWLLLAWLLTVWMPPGDTRTFLIWAGALAGHGALMSMRYALPDLPAALLVAAAVLAAERGRPFVAALLVGAAGLVRETALAAAIFVVSLVRRSPRRWLTAALCVLICVLPLALWLDYLRSIYRWKILVGGDNLALFTGAAWKVRHVVRELSAAPLAATIDDAAALVGFVTQGTYLVWLAIKRRDATSWTTVGLAFLALTLLTSQPVWDGTPGAYTRIALPLALAANVELARVGRAPYWLIACANAGVIPGLRLIAGF